MKYPPAFLTFATPRLPRLHLPASCFACYCSYRYLFYHSNRSPCFCLVLYASLRSTRYAVDNHCTVLSYYSSSYASPVTCFLAPFYLFVPSMFASPCHTTWFPLLRSSPAPYAWSGLGVSVLPCLCHRCTHFILCLQCNSVERLRALFCVQVYIRPSRHQLLIRCHHVLVPPLTIPNFRWASDLELEANRDCISWPLRETVQLPSPRVHPCVS